MMTSNGKTSNGNRPTLSMRSTEKAVATTFTPPDVKHV